MTRPGNGGGRWRRFALAMVAAAAGARAASAGEITGTVRDGPANAAPVAGAEVVLAARSADGTIERRSVTTDASGRYAFSALAEDSTITYVVNVRFENTDHPGPFITLSPRAPSAVHDASVSALTRSETAPVRIEAAHWIVAAGAGAVEITEVYSLLHQGHAQDGNGARLRFALPAGYHEFLGRQGIDPAALRLDESGFVLDEPVEPGLHEIIFTYHLDANGYPVRIEHAIPYPADALDVLVHPETATVGSETLTMLGVESLGDRNFLHLSRQGLSAGEPVSLVLSSPGGGGAATPAAAGASPGLGAGISLAVALATGVLFGLPVSRLAAGRRSKKAEMAARRRSLTEEVAVLDLRHEAGEVSEADFRPARTALMNRLHILARKMEEDDEA